MNSKILKWTLYLILANLKPNVAEKPKSSVALVIDTTGSMSDEVDLVKKTAITIIDKMTQNKKMNIETLIMVPFNDPDFGPALSTTDTENFKNEINNILVTGGGDCPEKCLNGISIALEESLQNSYIYVFTDADPNDGHLIDNILNKLLQKKAQIMFLLTGTCSLKTHETYQKISEASSGQIFDLRKNDLDEFSNYMNVMIEENVNSENLYVGKNPAGHGFNQSLYIDNTISNISISVAGNLPEIDVFDPSGNQVTSDEKIKLSVNLSRMKIVNLIDPAPGNWTVTVGSDSEHSVKISGISDVRFDYWFSASDDFKDISDRPVIDDPEINVLIEIHDDNNKIKDVTDIEILNTKGDILKVVPLTKTLDKTLYRTTHTFETIEGFFYLSIIGIDTSGNPFRRVGRTAIKTNNKRNIVLDENIINKLKKIDTTIWVEFNKPVVIACNITEFYEPVFSWKFPDETFVEKAGGKVTIAKMSKGDEGIYECTATDGVEKRQLQMPVFGYIKPYIIKGLRDKYPYMYSNFSLSCQIAGSPLPTITWQLDEKSVDSIPNVHVRTIDDTSVLNVVKANTYNSGEYLCSGENKFGIVVDSAMIEMRLAPPSIPS